MKKLLIILFCNILALTAFSQTEEERRTIIAAKNKIKSDSLSLHSRSERVKECKKKNEELIKALENSYKTIILYENLENSLRTDLEICNDSLSLTQTQLDTAIQKADKEEKRKKRWRKGFFITLGVVAVETAILFFL